MSEDWRRRWAALITILWLASLLAPALNLSFDREIYRDVRGYDVLTSGWIALAWLQPAWLANLTLAGTVLALTSSSFGARARLLLGLASAALALCSFDLAFRPEFNGFGGLRLGFALWLAANLLAGVVTAAEAVRARRG